MARVLALNAIILFIFQLQAAEPRGCIASAPLGSFQLSVQPSAGGPARPVNQVNLVQAGHKLLYRPIQIAGDSKDKARVSLILVPASASEKLAVLDPHPAASPAEWTAPFRISVVGVVFGPQGLDRKKVKALVAKDQELVSQMADYAQQTAQVEALIGTLAAADQNPSAGRNLDAALNGFASQYGVSLTKLDRSAPTDQQAMLLLRSLNPALGAYDPLAPQAATRMQQSAGLAASVAGLFFGSSVGLAAGGAALTQNLRTLMFPDTDFRSALAQPAASNGMTLCAKRQPARSRTRIAYLWAHRLPNAGAPTISLKSGAHLPIGAKSQVNVTASDWKYLDRAQDWSLVVAEGTGSFPVPVKPAAASQSLEIDLTKTAAPPGTYRLAAKWDWDSFQAGGDLRLHAVDDLKTARMSPASQDRLIEGTSTATAKLIGADFEFVDKIELKRAGDRKPAAAPVEFTLPLGRRAGPQDTIEVVFDASGLKRGSYALVVHQEDGSAAEVPFRVLPPNPTVENLPLRANLGEPRQKFLLRGAGLDRIERMSSKLAEIELEPARPNQPVREGSLRLRDGFAAGERDTLCIKVEGIETPLELPGALVVIGPRPRIASAQGSWPDDLGVALHDGELPAGSFVSFSLSVDNMDAQPAVRLECRERDKTLRPEALRPGENSPAARLQMAGTNVLFLSFNPGAVGQAGCTIAGIVETGTGASDPHPLGKVVRLPRIESFTLTDEKLGENKYAGILTGRDLETIEKAGWDDRSGLPVEGLPKPIAGEGQKQSLKIALNWPSPAPRAPIYIWLRGESAGRQTKARY